ncbi:uncharacterized protein LOC135469120 [Liolophura sinensis]|uniref:uncharacterized protein LOC135469120 n=1 Tax=Liolophura sinensis TaxID=3198878 RepID=UPI00315835C9
MMASSKKGKVTSVKSRKGLFQNLVFVVSHTEDPHVTGIIKEHGGKVAKALTEKTDFFVQGYNKEDDGRLGEAGDKNVRVISPEYLYDCLESSRVLETHSQALGPVETGDGFLHCMHTSAIVNCFKPPGIQCREREELPQSFGEFLKTEKFLPVYERNTIYLLPFDRESRPSTAKKRTADGEIKTKKGSLSRNVGKQVVLDRICQFLVGFFCMSVKILPALFLTVGKKDATLKAGRYNYSIAVHRTRKNNIRLDAMEIIGVLEELRPKDGFCILGITSEDICEDPSDKAPLLGRATGDQAGVLSTCYHDKAISQKHQAKSGDSLRALLNTAAHEIMHMFGMDHCSYYSCVMNSWSDPTADPSKHPEKVSPLHLCPIDLRKLHYSVGFDCVTRYKNLQKVYLDFGINEEVEWIEKILEIINKEKK